MKQYLELLQAIKDKGTHKPAARENMPGTLSLFGYQFRHDLQSGFPLLTTKKLSFKNIVVELLWFLRGDTNIKYLVDNGCNIWNEDQQNFVNRNNWTEEGSTGYQYPWLWRTWGKEDIRWQPKPNFKDPFFSKELPEIKESKSKFVGQRFKTEQGYEYLIYDYDSNKNIYYLVFIHNGLLWEKKNSSNFEKVEYPYHKNCFGIACIGRTPSKSKLYSIWRGMINRCYDTNNISYGLYGGKGVYVDDRWLCFEYFEQDVQQLQNWKLKQENWKKYTLEKDFGRGYVYSKDDCIWSQYNFSRLDRPKFYTFENPKTTEVYKTNNIADFGRYIGKEKLINSHSKNLIDGKLKTLGGWRLKSVEDFSNQGIDQITELIDELKKSPMSRRHIITAWNPATLNDMALPACHLLTQFNCRPLTLQQKQLWLWKNRKASITENVFDEGTVQYEETEVALKELWDSYNVPQYYIDCKFTMRSTDVFLGLPYNIASYALLTHILAKICNMEVGDLIVDLGDVHIYDNHMEAVNEQLNREPKKLPKLLMSDAIGSFVKYPYEIGKFDLDLLVSKLKPEDFQLEEYDPYPPIKAKLSTGLS